MIKWRFGAANACLRTVVGEKLNDNLSEEQRRVAHCSVHI